MAGPDGKKASYSVPKGNSLKPIGVPLPGPRPTRRLEKMQVLCPLGDVDGTQLVSHESSLSNFMNSEVDAAHDRDRMLMGKTEEEPVFHLRLQRFGAFLKGGGSRPYSR